MSKKNKTACSQEFNLFDFGINDQGEYVNFAEEALKKEEISINELQDFVNNHENPLVKIVFDNFFGWWEFEKETPLQIKQEIEEIVNSKCYHYGNMQKGIYVFSLKSKDRFRFIFENEKYYLVFSATGGCKEGYEHTELDSEVDDYLKGEFPFIFPACYCSCYDLKGNKIEDYAEQEHYEEDIRHIVVIKEFQMDKFSVKNRIEPNKKIKDFYEVLFYMRDFINYWGENDSLLEEN